MFHLPCILFRDFLQIDMHDLGLSSLGAAEAHVMPSLDAVIALAARAVAAPEQATDALNGETPPPPPAVSAFAEARMRLLQHADLALGPSPPRHATRVMVTMPPEAADDPTVTAELIAGGMTLARINCAHDGPDAWARMAANIRAADTDAAAAADRRTGVAPVAASTSVRGSTRRTLISFDLAGPKLRTGALAPGPAVMSWHPPRDARGVHTQVVRIMLSIVPSTALPHCSGHDSNLCEGAMWVPLGEGGRALIAAATPGDEIELRDARNATTLLTVLATTDNRDGIVVAASRAAYVERGAPLPIKLQRLHKIATTPAAPVRAAIGDVPARPQPLVLASGDTVRFVFGDALSRGPTVADPVSLVSIDVPAVFENIRVGHRVLLDDGKFSGVVESTDANSFTAVLTTVLGGTAKLGAEKGINLPDTELHLPALGPEDAAALDAALRLRPDLIALSFVQGPADVATLQARLDAAGAAHVGIILKIETAAGFANLPALVLQGLRRPGPFAIMIARGDLGVEVGFARMAEVQEELLWLAEAAHVPVIWATQVLDSLAKTGVPTRGDVTDAAAAERAECVMLNKGPFMKEVLSFLDDVLSRTAAHEAKRRHLLRPLAVASRAFAAFPELGVKPAAGTHQAAHKNAAPAHAKSEL